MQTRLQVELYEWASFKYEEIQSSKTYGYLNNKLAIEDRAGRAKEFYTSKKLEIEDRAGRAKEFYTSGGVAKLEWPQTAKD